MISIRSAVGDLLKTTRLANRGRRAKFSPFLNPQRKPPKKISKLNPLRRNLARHARTFFPQKKNPPIKSLKNRTPLIPNNNINKQQPNQIKAMYHVESKSLEDSEQYEIRITFSKKTPLFSISQSLFFEDKEVKVRISAVKRRKHKKASHGHGKHAAEVKESAPGSGVSGPREGVTFEASEEKVREAVQFKENQPNQSVPEKPKKHKKAGLSERPQSSHRQNIKSFAKNSQELEAPVQREEEAKPRRDIVTFHKQPEAARPPRAAREPRGLRNLGNSCYVNSVLQCLNAASPFVSALIDKTYVVNADTASRGEIIDEMSAIVLRLRSEEKEVDSSSLMEKVRRLAPQFENTKQNDARSFLLSLLDFIHEDVKYPREAIEVAASEPEAWIEETPETSIVNDSFYGMVKYSMTCDGKQIEENELFPVLSLPVPEGGRPELDGLLDLVERDCFECMKRHKAKVELIRQPPIWMVHLDRFSEKEKIETNVAYQHQWNGYQLEAVLHHSGSLLNGHYWAQVKMGAEWFVCNDAAIERIEEREVGPSNTAYILFYAKC